MYIYNDEKEIISLKRESQIFNRIEASVRSFELAAFATRALFAMSPMKKKIDLFLRAEKSFCAATAAAGNYLASLCKVSFISPSISI